MRNIQITSVTLAAWIALTLGSIALAEEALLDKTPSRSESHLNAPAKMKEEIGHSVKVIHQGKEVIILVPSLHQVQKHVYHRDTNKLDLHAVAHENAAVLTLEKWGKVPGEPVIPKGEAGTKKAPGAKKGILTGVKGFLGASLVEETMPADFIPTKDNDGSRAQLTQVYHDRMNREDLALLRVADAVRRDKVLSQHEKAAIFKKLAEHASVSREEAQRAWAKDVAFEMYSKTTGNAGKIHVSAEQANQMLSMGLPKIKVAFARAQEILEKHSSGSAKERQLAVREALYELLKVAKEYDEVRGVSGLIAKKEARKYTERFVKLGVDTVKALSKSVDERSGESASEYRKDIDRVRKVFDIVGQINPEDVWVSEGGKVDLYTEKAPVDGPTPHTPTTVLTSTITLTKPVIAITGVESSAAILAQDAERERVGTALAPLCFVDDAEDNATRHFSTACCQTSDLESEGKPIAAECCKDDADDTKWKACSEAVKVHKKAS